MENKILISKLASIIDNQTKVLAKLAQQVSESSDPLSKVIHDATVSWSIKNNLSAKSTFSAGLDGKHYDVDVKLLITDPNKPKNFSKEECVLQFSSLLRKLFNQSAQENSSKLFGCTVNFNVTLV